MMYSSTSVASNKIPVLVIDDRALLRQGTEALVAADPRLEIAASASSLHEAVGNLAGAMPSVVLLSCELTGQDVIAISREARSLWPGVRIVMIVPTAHDPIVTRALSIGVDAIVTKWDSFEVVRAAMESVYRGRRYFTPAINARIKAQRGNGTPGETETPVERPTVLTPREFEVLCYLVGGRTVRETAGVMTLAVNTVDNHKTRLMKKLDIHSNVALTRYAIREGLVAL